MSAPEQQPDARAEMLLLQTPQSVSRQGSLARRRSQGKKSPVDELTRASSLSLNCTNLDFQSLFLRIRSAPTNYQQPDGEELVSPQHVMHTDGTLELVNEAKAGNGPETPTAAGRLALPRLSSGDSAAALFKSIASSPTAMTQRDQIDLLGTGEGTGVLSKASSSGSRSLIHETSIELLESVASLNPNASSPEPKTTLRARRRRRMSFHTTDTPLPNIGTATETFAPLLQTVTSPANCDNRTPSPKASLPRNFSSASITTMDDCHIRSRRRSSEWQAEAKQLQVVTWNIAAINNNPFEYWVSHHTPDYLRLMNLSQVFIEDVEGRNDIPIHQIFSDVMFESLASELDTAEIEGVSELSKQWYEHYRNLPSLSRFLKDKIIGSKRLISMPDRFCNTIQTHDGVTAMRPSAISGFEGDLSSVSAWFQNWKDFMFRTLVMPSGSDKVAVVQTLRKIPSAKYPAISEEEEQISIPLQVLALAIFDAILINMLNIIAPTTWSNLKSSLSESLNKNKLRRLVDILAQTHAAADVIFIQEASHAFIDQLHKAMDDSHFVLVPAVMDEVRKQNSLTLVKKNKFMEFSCKEITSEVLSYLEKGQSVAPGDVFAISILGPHGKRYVLGSMHGDTNGLTSLPMMDALHKCVSERYADQVVIVGIDANTIRKENKKSESVLNFHRKTQEMEMGSCWKEEEWDVSWTTCSARTFIQPQLQKAQGSSNALSKETTQLKDWILFYNWQLWLEEVHRDNTGVGVFEEKVMPTMSFPSDHALVSATLNLR